MFHYADGGSYAEQTLRRNVADLENIALRQRVLKDMSQLDTEIELFGEKLSMPAVLAPVGALGMYARRGEVQSAKAAENKEFHLHTFHCFLSVKNHCSNQTNQCGFNCMY